MTRIGNSWVAVILSLTFTQGLFGQQPKASDGEFPGNQFVKARLVAEADALVPGKASQLAVVFEITKGWHLYWRNPGDSGMPPEVKIDAPSGVDIGNARWPAPHKQVEGGMLVSYVFEDRLVLLFPITLSKGFSGNEVTLRARIDWLVCKEKCVPGRVHTELKIPVKSSNGPSGENSLIRETEVRIPKPMGPGIRPFATNWERQSLILSAPGAARMAFFPYTNEEDAYPEDMVHGGQTRGAELRLTYDSRVAKLRVISGVLVMTRSGQEACFELMIPIQARSKHSKETP